MNRLFFFHLLSSLELLALETFSGNHFLSVDYRKLWVRLELFILNFSLLPFRFYFITFAKLSHFILKFIIFLNIYSLHFACLRNRQIHYFFVFSYLIFGVAPFIHLHMHILINALYKSQLLDGSKTAAQPQIYCIRSIMNSHLNFHWKHSRFLFHTFRSIHLWILSISALLTTPFTQWARQRFYRQ